MQLGTITRTQIFIMIIILELGLAGLFVYFSYMPTSQKITELDTVIKEKTSKVRRIETTKKELKDLENRVVELKKEISRLEQQFKEELFITRTLFLLEQLTLATKIDIVSFKPSAAVGAPAQPAAGATPAAPAAAPAANAGQPVAPGGQAQKSAKMFNESQEFKKAAFDLDLMGNFSSLNNFLNELTTFPKLVVVDKIEITQQTQGSAPEQTGSATEQQPSKLLQIKIPLTFFVQKQQSLVTVGGEKGAGAKEDKAKSGGR